MDAAAIASNVHTATMQAAIVAPREQATMVSPLGQCAQDDQQAQ
jgi:hypothetical protein